MRFNSRTWGLLSILLFVAAVWFWLRGNEEVARREATKKAAVVLPSAAAAGSLAPTNRLASPPSATAVSTSTAGVTSPPAHDGFPYRLRNTEKTIDELGRLDTALLLDNAFIDTAVKTPLTIPEHLRAGRDPGSYVVQARGPIDGSFYARLQTAGAEFVSYIPNNAVLVRANLEQATRLAALPEIQAVLRFEPMYKLSQSLLPLAVEQRPLPNDQAVNIVAFPGQRDQAVAAIRNAGGSLIAEDRTPFGPLLTVQPHPDSLATLAGVAEIQRIEPAFARGLLNDLTRVRLGISSNSVTPDNPWLGCVGQFLTGTNILVNINDTGVDATQPDLAGRVFSTDTNSVTLLDNEGHGTHVAGTIASSGASSSTVVGADGSVPGANFRGKAPGAKLFVLPIDLQVGPLASDSYLQETAAHENYVVARKTDPMISNNSWGYVNAFDYNSISASYDAAVRDALPGLPGSQPLLYVFAAGNSGFGTTNGVGGEAGTILSPANAKNVIAVGALESPRGLTNEAFAGYTDSDDEVASFSSRGNVGIGTEGKYGRFKPDVIAPGTFIVSTRSQNAPPDLFDLGPLYRYNTGTSMAAPAVSGLLALMQQFFGLESNQGHSPALFKALLINGARSVNATYDLRVRRSLNIEGWGLVNLTNSLPYLDYADTGGATAPCEGSGGGGGGGGGGGAGVYTFTAAVRRSRRGRCHHDWAEADLEVHPGAPGAEASAEGHVGVDRSARKPGRCGQVGE